ncbi:hypothetical protein BD289DRAFT_74917 [Coniella lustricola]|uniref:Uncharacterized protein n=1 Tax=Coniella lustricola TaxID=2025994 RepID=A0A2T3AHV3_9PEZI|nr:hypothetical protein BD289DRAFT_74917 [Coniella lustricola]
MPYLNVIHNFTRLRFRLLPTTIITPGPCSAVPHSTRHPSCALKSASDKETSKPTNLSFRSSPTSSWILTHRLFHSASSATRYVQQQQQQQQQQQWPCSTSASPPITITSSIFVSTTPLFHARNPPRGTARASTSLQRFSSTTTTITTTYETNTMPRLRPRTQPSYQTDTSETDMTNLDHHTSQQPHKQTESKGRGNDDMLAPTRTKPQSTNKPRPNTSPTTTDNDNDIDTNTTSDNNHILPTILIPDIDYEDGEYKDNDNESNHDRHENYDHHLPIPRLSGRGWTFWL